MGALTIAAGDGVDDIATSGSLSFFINKPTTTPIANNARHAHASATNNKRIIRCCFFSRSSSFGVLALSLSFSLSFPLSNRRVFPMSPNSSSLLYLHDGCTDVSINLSLLAFPISPSLLVPYSGG